MIGYDLVSIADYKTRRLSLRYVRKVLSEDEQKLLKQLDGQPEINFWSLWASKESAFKCIPNEIQPRFNPMKISITSIESIGNDQMITSSFSDQKIFTKVFRSNGYVEAISRWEINEFSGVHSENFIFDGNQPNDRRSIVQKMSLEKIQQKINKIPFIEMAENGKPMLSFEDGCEAFISISHDEELAGFAFLMV